MSNFNPTLSAASQFVAPFDILPNVIYTNPTTKPNPQFKAPFDILPNNNKIPLTPTFGINNYDKTSAVPKESNVNNNTEWKPLSETNTNITIETAAAKAAGLGLSVLGGLSGIGIISQVGESLFGAAGNDKLSGEFVTLPKEQLTNAFTPGVKYPDFRTRYYPVPGASNIGQQVLSLISTRRLDGLAAVGRSKGVAQLYAAATQLPQGPYAAFNLETWYGWGEHDNPNAIRSDFTLRSSVTTRWKKGSILTLTDEAGASSTKKQLGYFAPTINPQEVATPFRGDKVSVIDFSQRKLKQAYQWKPKIKIGGIELPEFVDKTQDFIKFYFTGPKLFAGNEDDQDDIIVFRAVITTFSENFNPGWTDIKMIGRGDSNYTYTGMTRDLTLDFDIYATDRDELKPIYRKLNALAGYTAPTYVADSITMQAPWMRITIGDLFVQTPVVLTSLGYTYDVEAPWEINIEQDTEMMQVPRKLSVSCGFNVISDYLPQKGGRFWTLAKRFEKDATPKAGDDNWLSDSLGNVDQEKLIEAEMKDGKLKRLRKTKVSTGTVNQKASESPLPESTDQFKFVPPTVLDTN
jgi:hypothetical protein